MVREEWPSGADARVISGSLIGTTKVVHASKPETLAGDAGRALPGLFDCRGELRSGCDGYQTTQSSFN